MKKKTTEASKSGNKVAVLNPDFEFRRVSVLYECRRDVTLEIIMGHNT